MTKVLICGDLAWSGDEAKEMFAGLAEIIVRLFFTRYIKPETKPPFIYSEWTLPTGPIS